MGWVLLLVFASIVCLGAAVASFGRRPEQRRLARLATGEVSAPDAESVLTRQEPTWLQRIVRVVAGEGLLDRDREALAPIRRRLVQAGFRRDDALMTYMASRVVLALALPLLLLALPWSWSLNELQLVTALCAAAGIGLVAPSIWLDRRLKARQKAVELALPDALDLMVVCVEAGLGINASLKRIAHDFRATHPVLSSEFELANFEMRAGKSTTQALRGLAERTGISDVSTLVAMLIQTERFGTGLADTLRVHADAMRLRRLQRAEEQANKAPLKMLMPTVFIFVAILLIIVGPGLLQLSQQFTGR